MTPRKYRISSTRFAARSGWVEQMSAFDKYPLGKPAFVTHTIDRAAHFRTNDDKLFALEGQSNARAYVVYRDSLVMKQEESGPRALLSIKEALGYGANPGTIFLGLGRRRADLRHGDFAGRHRKTDRPQRRRGHGIARHGDAGPGADRAIVVDRDGEIAGELASAPRILRQLRRAHLDEGRRLEARMRQLQGRAFPAHRSGRDHVRQPGRQGAARPAEAVHARHVFVPRRLCRSRGDHRGRRTPRDFRGIRHPRHRRELLHDAAVALSVVADDRLHGARDQRGHRRRPRRARGCALVRPRRTGSHAQAPASRRPVCRPSVRHRASFDRAMVAWRTATTAHSGNRAMDLLD